MLVWGGLHESAPIGCLEIYDFATNLWRLEVPAGVEPSPRFGHSLTYVPSLCGVILVGGSDGNDLVRNGQELREVYILRIHHRIDDQSVSFEWIRSELESVDGTLVPGRCHWYPILYSKSISIILLLISFLIPVHLVQFKYHPLRMLVSPHSVAGRGIPTSLLSCK